MEKLLLRSAMKTIKFTVNGEEVKYIQDPTTSLIILLTKLGLKVELNLIIKPIDVLGRFEPVEIFPT